LEEKDRLANSATSKTWLAAAQARDWRTVALLYTEDAILMPPNGPPVVGRENIRAWFADFPPLSRFHTETLEVVGCGDLSYLRGRYELTFEVEGSNPVSDTGKYLEIRRRQPDGSWLLSRDTFNSDLPLPGGGQHD
jgi:ketosteroid isomerase-like protein